MREETKSAGQLFFEAYFVNKFGESQLSHAEFFWRNEMTQDHHKWWNETVSSITAPLHQRIADLEAELAELKPKGWFDETCDNEECGAKFETNNPIENRPCPQCGDGVLRRTQ